MTDFFEKKLHIRYLLLTCAGIGIIAALIFGRFVISDNIEHLRASYLVSAGYMPYRDFFEHHHPLLWYVFAPLLSVLPKNTIFTFYVVRSVVLIVSGFTFFVIFLLLRKMTDDKKIFSIFLMFACTFLPMWYGVSLFKPDAFAHLFYFIGLYYLFDYIRQQRRSALVCCVIASVLAFMFLQTIAFSIFLWIFPMFFLFGKSKNFYRDLAVALGCALIILGTFFTWFYIAKAWPQYWQQNWLFNARLFPLLQAEAPSIIGLWSVPFCVAAATGIWLCKVPETTVYLKIIVFLFIGEIIQRMLFKVVFPHYLILAFILASLILAHGVRQINRKILYGYVYAYTAICVVFNFITLTLNDNRQIMQDWRQVSSFRKYSVFNIDFSFTDIYAPLSSYYAATFNNLAIIDNYLFNRFPNYDINAEIEKHDFQYLNYIPEHASITVPTANTAQFQISAQTLQKYQRISPFLWQKKQSKK